MIVQFVSVLLILVAPGNAQDETVAMSLLTDDQHGWSGQFRVPLNHRVLAWELKMDFNMPVTNLKATGGELRGADGGRSYELVNALDNGSHNASDVITVNVTGSYTGTGVLAASARFVDLSSGPQTVPIIPATPTGMQKTDYNYLELLEKSLLFYEAQRSGKLPANNRIPWRFDSALGDRGNKGEDLSGGYYDAGDLVKFNFPMANSMALLAWGYLQWTDAYTATGLEDQLKDTLKWGLDYFLKCHVSPHELYVQVGDPDIDHPLWNRPENMTMRRPAYKITEQHPGSEVAAETAAAMAAGYMAFQSSDQTYANTLLTHARQLFEFAVAFPGKATESLNIHTYATSDYRDEVFWAASWLYKATGEKAYKDYALAHKTSKPRGGASWEDKTSYADALLYPTTTDAGIEADLDKAIKSWLPGGSLPYTPGGLVFASNWGSLKNAENLVLVALMAADSDLGNVSATALRCWAKRQLQYSLGDNPHHRRYVAGFGVNPPSHYHHRPLSESLVLVALMAADSDLGNVTATTLRCWAKRQLQYSLGDNPLHRSYVAGFGVNPPTNYHHRPSSCPNILAPCGWEAFNNPGPNPHILYGALVGGPGLDDSYADLRSDYVKNEVALDYNAAFQSSIAGLVHLALHNRLPENCP